MKDTFECVDRDGDKGSVRWEYSGEQLYVQMDSLYLDQHAVNRLAQYLDQHRTDTPKAVEPKPDTLCGTRWTQVREDMADMDKRLREAERTLARAEAVKEHADTVDAAREHTDLKCACGHGWSDHGLNGCGADRLDRGMGSRCPCTRFTLGARS